jgi:hypothetical protein
MAPNRKNVVILDLPAGKEGLQSTLQAKFLPLTDPREQKQHDQQMELQQQSHASESASYWDWSADTKAEEEAEKVADLFSLSHIVSNLIRDSQKYASAPSNQIAAHDDYWADHSQEDKDRETVSSKPQHESDSFWYWPANQKVYEEEKAFALTSAIYIESNLCRQTPVHASTSNLNEQHDSYWAWPSRSKEDSVNDPPAHRLINDDYWVWETMTPEEQKNKLIQSIMEYEAARELLSAKHIEDLLVHDSSLQHDRSAAPVITTASSYWDW